MLSFREKLIALGRSFARNAVCLGIVGGAGQYLYSSGYPAAVVLLMAATVLGVVLVIVTLLRLLLLLLFR